MQKEDTDKGGDGHVTQVIYADVYFLINFSMDFLALYLTGKLRHRTAKTRRQVAAAALGGLYATLALTWLAPWSESLLTLLLPLLFVAVAFGVESVGGLVRDALVFFAVSFAMGGVMTAVYYGVGKLLASREIYINGTVETLYSDLPLAVLGLTAALAALIAYLWGRFCKKRAAKRTLTVVIGDGGQEYSLSALCDSGNLLEEPLGHLPVIVLSDAAMHKVVPAEWSAVFFADTLTEQASRARPFTRLRFIPVTTVSDEGLLRGYVPDYVRIGKETKRACLAWDRSGGDFDGQEALVPTQLL